MELNKLKSAIVPVKIGTRKVGNFPNSREINKGGQMYKGFPVSRQYKYLGIIFDKELSSKPHFNYLKAKLSRIAGCIRLILKPQSKIKTAQLLYAILIRPHFWYWSYGLVKLGLTLRKEINRLERKVVKTIVGLHKSSDSNIINIFTQYYNWETTYSYVD